ncbi:MAG: hypothetical protein KDD47_04370 [Acidobacteria bacterium]|nr:hypothetical protein [Acidobacteriota bacterium]
MTLRNIPADLQRRIEEEASESRSSLNKTVLRLLEKATGVAPEGRAFRRFHDLDRFAGTWTKEEAAEFDEALAEQRRIDPELWK